MWYHTFVVTGMMINYQCGSLVYYYVYTYGYNLKFGLLSFPYLAQDVTLIVHLYHPHQECSQF